MILPFIIFSLFYCTSAQVNDTVRGGKALSVFQVIRFPNVACVGSSSLNGTCYTSSECTNKGGTNSGSCANGFGVCCAFTLSCGAVTSENCTYFQSSAAGQASGQCGMSVCKTSTDICQLRLDFTTFLITGPSTLTVTSIKTVNGGYAPGGATGVSLATNCLTDSFSVTGYTSAPPVICGTNTNSHMYVDASPACNNLLFQLGPAALGTTLATRSWNIKISQISCLSTTLPPQGCTQYFTGTFNTITSYNQAGGVQLASQRQNICIRRERGYCKLCLTPTDANSLTDFAVSSVIGMGFTANSKCCGFGNAGAGTNGLDCIILPNAVKNTAAAIAIPGNHFCGKYLVSADATAVAKTICTTTTPFNVQFLTDEITIAAAAVSGFRLQYFQTTC